MAPDPVYKKLGQNIDIILAFHGGKTFAIEISIYNKEGQLLDGFTFELNKLWSYLLRKYL
jgi:hypothetical protein